MMREDSKRGMRGWALAGLAAVSLALAGCGGTAPDIQTLNFKSPGVQANGIIRPAFQCGGGALWIPLAWGKLPPATKELAIYFSRYRHERGNGRSRLVVPYGDLIYHSNPSVHRIAANTLPGNIGWSNSGNVNCPSPDTNLNLAVELFALSQRHFSRHLGHLLAVSLTREALGQVTPNSTSSSGKKLMEDTVGIGSFVASYRP
jgi:hypothetical protein